MSKRGFTPRKQKKAEPASNEDKTIQKAIRPTSTLQLIKPAFELFKDNFALFAWILIVPMMLSILGRALMGDIDTFLDTSSSNVTPTITTGAVLATAATLWLLYTVPVAYYVQVKLVSGERPGIIQCYRQGMYYLLRIYGLFILLGCLLLISLPLIIVPFILLRRYVLAPYFLVDGNTGIRAAMQQSAAVTKKHRRFIWATLILIAAVSLASIMITFFLKLYGEVLVLPISSILVLILALRYKELVAIQQSSTAIKD